MSAERRFNQRRFHLEESLTQNGGARTVFIEHMTPGTTVPPHYHTRQYKFFISSPYNLPHCCVAFWNPSMMHNFVAPGANHTNTRTQHQASPRPSTCSRAPSRSTPRRRPQPQPGTQARTWTSWSGPP